MERIKAVVIDDEISNRRLITKLVSKLHVGFEISGEAKDVKSGYQVIKEIGPQLVFLDIKMPDGSGFDLLGMFEEINFEVVFITGFDSYALKAFEFNALDYVLKPVNPLKFSKTLNKVFLKVSRERNDPNKLMATLKAYNQESRMISRIPVHYKNHVVFLDIEDIMYIKSEDKCTLFKLNTDEKYLSSKELSDFLFILERYPYMVKINKSIFININFIASYSKGSNCLVSMKDGSVFDIPRRKKTEILALFREK
jgi:two-component system LytT family response regulator